MLNVAWFPSNMSSTAVPKTSGDATALIASQAASAQNADADPLRPPPHRGRVDPDGRRGRLRVLRPGGPVPVAHRLRVPGVGVPARGRRVGRWVPHPSPSVDTSGSRGLAAEAREHARDVHAERLGGVAALEDEEGRPAERGDPSAHLGEVGGGQAELRDRDRPRRCRRRGTRPPPPRRARRSTGRPRRAPRTTRRSPCPTASGSCGWRRGRRPCRARPRTRGSTGTPGGGRRAARRTPRRRGPRRSPACRCRGGSPRRGPRPSPTPPSRRACAATAALLRKQ